MAPQNSSEGIAEPTGSHRREVRGRASEAIEDYAKAIHTLARREPGPVGTSALAERLGVSPGTVTAMLKRMAAMGLVSYEPYRGAELTQNGERTTPPSTRKAAPLVADEASEQT